MQTQIVWKINCIAYFRISNEDHKICVELYSLENDLESSFRFSLQFCLDNFFLVAAMATLIYW